MPGRKHDRLTVNAPVAVRFADREALFQVYLKDISRGGLFVESDHPFNALDRIEISLEVEGAGALRLQAEVVHVVSAEQAAAWNGHAGVGVQFTDLDDDKRDSLESYLDGLRDRLTKELEKAPIDTHLIQEIEKAHSTGNLYQVLGIDLRADEVETEVAVESRSQVLDNLARQAAGQPALVSRIRNARAAVLHAAAVLRDDRQRVIYLFQIGLLPLQELLELLRPMKQIREEVAVLWAQQNPSLDAAGKRLAPLALHAAQLGDYKGAIKTAKLALAQNPFLFELRDAIEQWLPLVPEKKPEP